MEPARPRDRRHRDCQRRHSALYPEGIPGGQEGTSVCQKVDLVEARDIFIFVSHLVCNLSQTGL